ncbi:MAG TPA: radical SAM protein [bacterium (Candidatus Stahlbacteria)]|nr:radical SAM protein [Candidatus Stahlbacteria bacterium]
MNYSFGKIVADYLTRIGEISVTNPSMRRFLLKNVERKLYDDLIKANPDNRPLKVQEDKYYMGRALIHSIGKAFDKGYISKEATKGLIRVFLGNVFFGGFYKRRNFIEKHGFKPPMFITISPTRACNLRCEGCYAGGGEEGNKLEFDVFDRIIEDAKTLWGTNFFVISGGEPLIYRSQGKTFVDLTRKHSDCFFLMYTNGTLINKKMAKDLADLGNITPAISIEGFKKETDERRGKGVWEKTQAAMQNLRNEGVPFGISFTLTKYNADMVVSDEFLDFYFEKQGAIYGWIFHYMPIGRDYNLDLLPTPEQRVALIRKEWEIVKRRKIFFPDFWNSGTSSDGCICAARGGGYFYIDWNGDVMPCVFIHYSTHNINEVYKSGGNLDTIINSELFKLIRRWQSDYAYEQPPNKVGNLLRQCPVRDHYGELYKILRKTNARPTNEYARKALEDQEYREGLIQYGKEIEKLTKDWWKKEYLNSKSVFV